MRERKRTLPFPFSHSPIEMEGTCRSAFGQTSRLALKASRWAGLDSRWTCTFFTCKALKTSRPFAILSLNRFCSHWSGFVAVKIMLYLLLFSLQTSRPFSCHIKFSQTSRPFLPKISNNKTSRPFLSIPHLLFYIHLPTFLLFVPGGTKSSDIGLNLSWSQQQGCSTAYNTPSTSYRLYAIV